MKKVFIASGPVSEFSDANLKTLFETLQIQIFILFLHYIGKIFTVIYDKLTILQ